MGGESIVIFSMPEYLFDSAIIFQAPEPVESVPDNVLLHKIVPTLRVAEDEEETGEDEYPFRYVHLALPIPHL